MLKDEPCIEKKILEELVCKDMQQEL